MKALHDIIFDVSAPTHLLPLLLPQSTLPPKQLHVVEGKLVCQHCGREYPIKDGIPNMLLCDGEI